jgi:hypothetical protein
MITVFIITLLSSIGTINANEQLTNTTAHVFTEQGTILKAKGLITFASEDLISVFRKVKLPQMDPITNCNQRWIDDFNQKIEETTLEYIQLFSHIAYTNRKKRSLALLSLGLGAVDLLLSGFGFGKLSNQLHEISTKFETFTKYQHEFNNKQIEFDRKLVAVVQQHEDDVSETFKQVQCQFLDTSGHLLAHQYHDKWEKQLNSLFKPLREGSLKVPLTPDILSPEDLRKILNEHEMLQRLYFRKNIYSFYETAEMSVVQASFNLPTRTLTVHQIIHFPSLIEEQIFPLFKVVQVGMKKDDVCMMLDLPKYVYKREYKYFPIDELNCKIKDTPISACYTAILPNAHHNLCLNAKNLSSCEVRAAQPCQTRYVYDNSGILIGSSQEKVQIFSSDRHSKMAVLKPSELGTIYVPWNSVAYVQIGDNLLIQKPEFVSSYLEAQIDTSTWIQTVNESVKMLNRRSKLNSSELLNLIEDLPKFKEDHKSYKLLIFSLISVILGLILAVIIVIVCRRVECFKNLPFNYKHTNTDDPETEAAQKMHHDQVDSAPPEVMIVNH